jgi:hypothetical protein
VVSPHLSWPEALVRRTPVGLTSAIIAIKETIMKQTMPRLMLTAALVAASIGAAQAQTTTVAPAASQGMPAMPMTGMPMPGPMAGPGRGPMGGGMMDMMRPMMGGRGMMGMPFEHIEGRIAFLKTEVKITDAQTAQWNAFAEAMRANAAAMKAMHDGMTTAGMPTTLPERLAAMQKMMTAHGPMLARMEAAAKPLYAALTPDQQKVLDQLTAGPMGMM